MSYILDALKKSDQERQRGTSPSLYSVHSPMPSGKGPSAFKQIHFLSLIVGVFFLVFTCLGTFFFLHRQHPAENDSMKTTTTTPPPLTVQPQTTQTSTPPGPSVQATLKNEISTPLVVIKENDEILRSIPVGDDPPEPPTVIETEASKEALPFLKDLSPELQAEIPSLKCAGHTYSEEPSQRMIIINGKILKEGDMIAPNTRLSEITWDGVAIDFNGTRFLVNTN